MVTIEKSGVFWEEQGTSQFWTFQKCPKSKMFLTLREIFKSSLS
jgi:hypothetical protein